MAALAEIAAALCVLFAVYVLLRTAFARLPNWAETLTITLLFTAAAVYGMANPVTLADGVIAEPRGAILTLSALFGGPIAGAVTWAVTGVYRADIGGAGMLAGIVGNTLSVLAGIAVWGHVRRSASKRIGLRHLGVASLAAGIMPLLAFPLVDPPQLGLQLVWAWGPELALVQCGSAVLLGGLLMLDRDRRDTLSALGDSEARYRTLAETLPAVVTVTDPDSGAIFYANKTATDIFGPIDQPGTLASAASLYDRPDERVVEMADLRRDGHVEGREHVIRTPAGRRLFRFSSRLVEWQGHPAVLASALDVTESRWSEALNRSVLNTMEDGMVIVDAAGTVMSVNPSLERLFGLSLGKLQGRSITMVMTEAEAARHHQRLIQAKANDHSPYLDSPLTLEMRHQDGHELLVEVRVTQIADPATEQPLFVGLLRDVTEQLQYEEQLRDAREKAETASRAKSEFLATMSHELRTPLNAIIGFSELIMTEAFGPLGNERYRDYLTDIRQSGEHLLSLVNDVLDLARVEAGRADLHPEPLDAVHELRQVVRLVSERASARNITLTLNSSDGHDHRLQLTADPRAFRQVMLNLMSNAVKYIGTGGTVTLDLAREDGPDPRIVVTVADDGPGLPSSVVGAIGQPFVHVGPSAEARDGGTGLGIAIIVALVKAHGGDVSFENQPGRGLTVRTLWPETCPERVEAPLLPAAGTARDPASPRHADTDEEAPTLAAP